MTDAMDNIVNVPLGVTIAREAIDSPWADHIWRPVSVFLDAPPVDTWRLLETRTGYEHFHVATQMLELHRKETPGYIANLESDQPGIHVIIRQGAATVDGSEPVHVHLLTASGHDVEAYGHLGEEIIGKVSIPQPLLELIEAFIAYHHKEEVFRKRKRRDHHVADDHQFGQEPLHVLRARRGKSGDV